MNIALIDDIPMETERIRILLQKYAVTNSLDFDIRCFSHAEDLLADYHPFQYAVIFMDIYMEGMNGIDAAAKLRAADPDVLLIFLTGSSDYMSDAFRYHVYDYIQKPAEAARLFGVMDDILKKHTPTVDTLSFISSRTQYCLPYTDIVALRAVGHYLDILDKDNQVHKTRMTFSEVYALLSQDRRFLLILRGVIVNMDYVLRFSDGMCHLPFNRYLPINVRNSKKIEQTWSNYILTKKRSTIE